MIKYQFAYKMPGQSDTALLFVIIEATTLYYAARKFETDYPQAVIYSVLRCGYTQITNSL